MTTGVFFRRDQFVTFMIGSFTSLAQPSAHTYVLQFPNAMMDSESQHRELTVKARSL
jgi:hypothetical protein